MQSQTDAPNAAPASAGPTSSTTRPISRAGSGKLIERDYAILLMLPEGVFVAKRNDDGDQFHFTFCNPAFCNLITLRANQLEHMSIDDHLTTHDGGSIAEQIAQSATSTEKMALRGHVIPANAPRRRVPVHIKIARLDDHIICTVVDRSAEETRQSYLTKRATKLIDHANVLESTRRDLENEILRLRDRIKSLERAAKFDAASGLPNRLHFMERASAEFERAKRYEHPMALVIAGIVGFDDIIAANGPNGESTLMTALGQVCESVSRAGVDLVGRTGRDQVAILLPETNLTGALVFIDRLRSQIGQTPINIDDGFVRLGVRAGVDCPQSDDTSFIQSFGRAQDSLEFRGGQ